MIYMPSRRSLLNAAGLAVAGAIAAPGLAKLRATSVPTIVPLTASGGRAISVTRWRPATVRGTILFSHGALSSPSTYDLLILPLVAAGYEIWAPLHVDSTDHADQAAFTGTQGWAARLEDMAVLADQIGRDYIAVGHSYGGLVALTLGGASPTPPPGVSAPLRDPRAKAVVAFSPPGALPGLIDAAGYRSLAVPALIQTGTQDIPYTPPGTSRDPEAWRKHLLAYDEAAAGGERYALVLAGVDHYFGGAICDFTKPGPAQIAEAGQAARVATAFIDAYRPGRRAAAKRRLHMLLKPTGPVSLRSK